MDGAGKEWAPETYLLHPDPNGLELVQKLLPPELVEDGMRLPPGSPALTVAAFIPLPFLWPASCFPHQDKVWGKKRFFTSLPRWVSVPVPAVLSRTSLFLLLSFSTHLCNAHLTA